ncbi:hypothetical protein EV368DRAFT_83607 [Lentinula lateritia]|nr:hypothetical protein EV368DRAFT_83607 [Lentinula lateritia]
MASRAVIRCRAAWLGLGQGLSHGNISTPNLNLPHLLHDHMLPTVTTTITIDASPTSWVSSRLLPKLQDLDLSNVEATSHVGLRIASPLPPPTLKDVHPQAQSPGTYPPGHIPSQELTTSRPISIYDLFKSYIDVLASTTPTTQYYKVPYFYLTSLRLRDFPGPPRNPLKGHHLFVPATTRSFLSSVTVPVAPFELQPAPSTLQHKPSYTKPYLKTYSDPGKDSAEVCRFMAQFQNWALEQPDLTKSQVKLIKSALGFFTESAGDWATPHLLHLSPENPPFGGNWNKFLKKFKQCFESGDLGMEIITKSNFSNKGIALTLKEAIKWAISVDVYLHDPTMTGQNIGHAPTHTKPTDPHAMDIDTTHISNGNSREAFLGHITAHIRKPPATTVDIMDMWKWFVKTTTTPAPFIPFLNEPTQIATSSSVPVIPTAAPTTLSLPVQDFSTQFGQIKELLDHANTMSSILRFSAGFLKRVPASAGPRIPCN